MVVHQVQHHSQTGVFFGFGRALGAASQPDGNFSQTRIFRGRRSDQVQHHNQTGIFLGCGRPPSAASQPDWNFTQTALFLDC